MTREDALKWVVEHWGEDLEDGTKQSEVVKVIIDTLEQEPCEDAVSRKAVEEILDNMHMTYDGDEFDMDDVYEIGLERLKDLPSVKPCGVSEDIKAKLLSYEADCLMSAEDQTCMRCTADTFKSIDRIICRGDGE